MPYIYLTGDKCILHGCCASLLHYVNSTNNKGSFNFSNDTKFSSLQDTAEASFFIIVKCRLWKDVTSRSSYIIYLERARMAVSIMNTKQTVPCVKCVLLPGNEKSIYIDSFMHYKLTTNRDLAVVRDTGGRILWERRIACCKLRRLPVPVAARSKALVYGRSPAAIVGSNPNRGMEVCLLWVLCVVRYRSLRRTDHSFREVLPTVACRCVLSSNLVRVEAKARYRAVKYTPTMGCVAPGKKNDCKEKLDAIILQKLANRNFMEVDFFILVPI